MHKLLARILRPATLMVFDAVVALILVGVLAYAALDTSGQGAAREPTWVSWLAAIAIGAPVAARRRWPVPVLGVVSVAVVIAVLTRVVPVVAIGPAAVSMGIALYAVGSWTPRTASIRALAMAVLALTTGVLLSRLVAGPFEPWSDTVSGLGFAWFGVGAAWTMGLFARERRRYAEHTATQLARRAVAEERLRIARELHDIVAHSMSLIAVQAGIGNHVAEQRPAEAREALRVIEATSRGSLTEMRHLLGVLRSEVDSPPETAELTPSPGARDIPRLVERAKDAGVDVVTELAGTEELPDGVGLSVYRIVQEAVTNVVRHAGPARCVVRVDADGEQVRVEVTDDGRGAPTVHNGSGHGLIGMRERVMMYGGTFTAGERDEGGFRVAATFSYQRSETRDD